MTQTLNFVFIQQAPPIDHDYDLASVILTEFEMHVSFQTYNMEVLYSSLRLHQLAPLKLIVFAREEYS